MISHRNRKLDHSSRIMTEMARYVYVSPESMEQFLISKGFIRTIVCREIVYYRHHELDPKVVVKGYTSILVDDNGKSMATRGAGQDSIKVATVVEGKNKTYGIGKFPYITRTGTTEEVLARTLQRMRAAYARGTEWIREQITKEVMSS